MKAYCVESNDGNIQLLLAESAPKAISRALWTEPFDDGYSYIELRAFRVPDFDKASFRGDPPVLDCGDPKNFPMMYDFGMASDCPDYEKYVETRENA